MKKLIGAKDSQEVYDEDRGANKLEWKINLILAPTNLVSFISRDVTVNKDVLLTFTHPFTCSSLPFPFLDNCNVASFLALEQ